MDKKLVPRGIFCVVALLSLVQCSSPSTTAEATAPKEATAAPERSKSIRFAGAGNSYPGFSRVGLMMLGHLKPQYPDRDMWIDYHESGRQFRDGVLRVANHQAEIAFTNPGHLPALAVRGVGLFDKPLPIRGIGNYPSDDWISFAVDPKLGIKSINDIREKKLGLKIATAYMDGDNVMPILLVELLKRHGISQEDFKSWGGEITAQDYRAHPRGISAREAYTSSQVNAVFAESGYDGRWLEDIKKRPMTFIAVDPAVAKQLEADWGWPSRNIRANYYPGQPEPVLALDFTDWSIVVNADMEDDLAYQIAKLFVEKWDDVKGPPEIKPGMEKVTAGYGGNPKAFVPAEQIKMSIPLHPGAIKYYREKGLLKSTTATN